MVQFIPGGAGLFPYQNAGRNDFASFGEGMRNMLTSLLQYKQIRDADRTVGDVVKPPARTENPAYFGQTQPSLREMTGPGAGPDAIKFLGGAAPKMSAPSPAPMALPGQPNYLQNIVYGQGIQGARLSDLSSMSALPGLAGPDPYKLWGEMLKNQLTLKKLDSPLDDEAKRALISERKARTDYFKKGGNKGANDEAKIDKERRAFITRKINAFQTSNADLLQRMNSPKKGGMFGLGSKTAKPEEIATYRAGLEKIKTDAAAQFNDLVKKGKYKSVTTDDLVGERQAYIQGAIAKGYSEEEAGDLADENGFTE